jgi:cytochrome bd-type quinol oxidase subunit 1
MLEPLQDWWTWMVTRPTPADSLWGVISWWERRRVPYNLFLAAVGVPSLVLFYWTMDVSHSVQAGEDAVEPMALIAAPLLANIAYTLGWMVEGVGRRRPWVSPAGPRLMRMGLWFSLFVVLSPALLGVFAVLSR